MPVRSTPVATMASNLPTLGAVQVRNEKGVLVMQKVKVKRYVPGKKPDYAPDRSESEQVKSQLILSRFILVLKPALSYLRYSISP